ncbi:SulP family sulfate permease [Haloactinospora alba]|uniref:SulP family sulfate permease n=1 Tax=Haloactinospora alba TaxID=405555 RepID=A0A543NN44_9ACTN|nr:SulP family inorganic anion transporter [Haloactinospora alba]TQN33251.1 SulP family sulfate permease [Haloactinospora alba]
MTTQKLTWPQATLSTLSVLRTEALSGLVVALALIPNAISFSIIAGVDPRVGLYATFTMAVTTALLGGRPAMISSATAAMTLIVAPLGQEHGLDYILAATILAGVFQAVLGMVGVAKLMRFVPPSVMTGFVNALAVLIFTAQVPHFAGDGWVVYSLIGVGLAVIAVLPKLTRAIPAPLVSIVVITAAAWGGGLSMPTVGEMGHLPEAFPVPIVPDVPLTLETLQTIAPVAFTLALAGLMESLMTAKLVDEMTDTRSDKGKEARGQGIANIITGFFGGMAGCATVGPTVINVKSKARTRASTFLAGVFLLLLVVVLSEPVAAIPVAALVAVMIYVSITTMDWHSVHPGTLRRMPWSETFVMVVTFGVVVATHNLALGVFVGVITSMVVFARRAAHLTEVTSVLDPEGGARVYFVHGELFFASSNEIVWQFDYNEENIDHVTIDLSGAHVWDSSAVAALDHATEKFSRNDIEVEITGLNASSAALHRELSGTLPR